MDLLYKYREIDHRLYENIINGTLWFANLESFNDPFEKKKPVHYGATIESIEKFYNELNTPDLRKLLLGYSKNDFIAKWKEERIVFEKKLKLHWEEELNKIGILSLSKNGKNIQMWSHYSDSHKGICLEFDTSEHKMFDEKDKPKYINYPEDNHYQVLFDLETPSQTSILGLVMTKSNIWEEEKEVRMIKYTPGLYKFNRTTLSRVIFGCNSSSIERETIKKLVTDSQYINAKFSEVEIDDDEYKLNFKDYN